MKATRVILVTGCSSGIGRALSLEFATRPNTFVYATARNLESIAALKSQASKGNLDILPMDVTKAESVKKVIDFIVLQHQRIDILVNNAGQSGYTPSVDVPLDECRKLFEVNVFAAIQLIQQVAPVMAKNQSGLIVNIGSIVGLQASPYSGPYSASKAALHAWSDSLRMELAPFGVKVMVVTPGAIRSSIADNYTKSHELVPAPKSMYAAAYKYVVQRSRMSQNNPTSAEEFSQKTVSAVLQSSPPAYFAYGKMSGLVVFSSKWFPRWLSDWVQSRMSGLDKLAQMWRSGAYAAWLKVYDAKKEE